MSAGDCSTGLARRRMAAALSLYDHLQRQYLVLINPFTKLRCPRPPLPSRMPTPIVPPLPAGGSA